MFNEFYGFKVNSWNLPEARSGVYVFTNLVNGKHYVGESVNVLTRIISHSQGFSPRKFKNSINKHGSRSFLVEPVWYATETMTDKFYQLAVESELIVALDSIRNGYNVLQKYHQGKYGEEWGDYLKQFWTEDLRQRAAEITRTQFQDPARRKKQSDVIKNFLTENPDRAGAGFKSWWQNLTPEDKAAFLASREPKRIEAVKRSNAARRDEFIAATHTPEANAKRSASQREHWCSEEGKATLQARSENPEWLRKQREAGRARFATAEARQIESEKQKKFRKENPLIWITNGNVNQRIRHGVPIPDGFYLGRVCPNGTNDGSSAIGKIWITNGTINKRVVPNEPLPDGFRIGKRNSKWKNGSRKFWITNGIASTQHDPMVPVPSGWYKGRTILTKELE